MTPPPVPGALGAADAAGTSRSGGREGPRAGEPETEHPSHKGETPKARGEKTRRRIVEAVLSLLEEHEFAPTAKEVAERAGVSVRLVFHHFEDMDALYRAVAGLQLDRHWSQVRPVPSDLPLDQRVERTVQQRAKLFDAISPVRHTAAALAQRHSDVADAITRTNGLLGEWLAATFGPELGAAGRNQKELASALEVAASFEAWDHLRRAGLSASAARRVMSRTLTALLASDT